MNSPVDVWENEVYLAMKHREKLAWRIAFIAITVALVAVISWTTYFKLHHTEYVVVTVDRATGDANVSSIVESATVSTDQVLAEAFVYKYVLMRETYDSWDQKPRINEVFEVFTEGKAKEELFSLYSNENPQNPISRYGTDTKITVAIRYIEMSDSRSAKVGILKTFNTAGSERTQNFIVSMQFFSDLEREANLEFRRKNPVAFFVDQYRIVSEAS